MSMQKSPGAAMKELAAGVVQIAAVRANRNQDR